MRKKSRAEIPFTRVEHDLVAWKCARERERRLFAHICVCARKSAHAVAIIRSVCTQKKCIQSGYLVSLFSLSPRLLLVACALVLGRKVRECDECIFFFFAWNVVFYTLLV